MLSLSDFRGTYDETKAALATADRADLERVLLNEKYNRYIRDFADCETGEVDPSGHGKRVPYVGWFWRFVDFSRLDRIPIGDCGPFIGFMENNKWGYPERNMTPAEAKHVVNLLDESMAAGRRGGNLAEIRASQYKPLGELWDYLQTLELSE